LEQARERIATLLAELDELKRRRDELKAFAQSTIRPYNDRTVIGKVKKAWVEKALYKHCASAQVDCEGVIELLWRKWKCWNGLMKN
jgi:hypothetical protein